MGERGPKPKKINWAIFAKLCKYHCTMKEICDFFDCDWDTLNRSCLEQKGMKLTDLFEQKKGKGRYRLKKLQWNIAQAGSTGMAIFLGKQYLGQTDQPVDEAIIDAIRKAGMSKDAAIELILSSQATAKTQGKKSFNEFCIAAGYPPPFDKQVEMMEFGIFGEGARLLLGARGYGKTDYITILGIAYAIYVDPKITFLIITKSKDRNAAILQEIAHALTANGMMLEKQSGKCVRVHGLAGKDHSAEAITIKQSLRGRHPKKIIMDDPVTEDDDSVKTRARVEKTYNEALKLTGDICIIGQPVHKLDLYGKLRPLLNRLEVPHGTIPELDHDLEAQRLAGVSEESIQASYHLKILDTGSSPFERVKYLDKYPVGDSVAFIDPSFEGGDYTALSIVRSHFQGVAVVGFVFKRAWNHCLEDMVKRMKQFRVQKLCFETNALGDQPIIMLRQALGSGVVGKKSNGNKHSRIMAAGAFAHLIHLSRESDKKYIEHVVQYEYGAEFDDAPDSLASCLEWIGLIRGKL